MSPTSRYSSCYYRCDTNFLELRYGEVRTLPHSPGPMGSGRSRRHVYPFDKKPSVYSGAVCGAYPAWWAVPVPPFLDQRHDLRF